MKEYKYHELAGIFDLIEGEEYKGLKEDIRKNDLMESIKIFEGKILDGRNRYRVCKELGIEGDIKILPNTINPLEYVWSVNYHRRHLTSAQKADAVIQYSSWLEELEEKAREKHRIMVENQERNNKGQIIKKQSLSSEDKHSKIKQPIQQDIFKNTIITKKPEIVIEPINVTKEQAKKARVSEETIQIAKKVKKMNDPQISKKWEQARKGKTTIKAVKMAIDKKVKPKILPILPIDKYDVIYADPPWTYNFTQAPNRSIEKEYPTMDIKDICKLKIPSADNSILFLWCTSPKLIPEGVEVIRSWGFTYKTSMVWVKDKIGMGYYARSRHEFLLIATKGKPGVPEPAVRPDSVIEAPRTKHSKKPELYEMIERMYPNRKYLELFARNKRENWKSWGNEV